MSATGNIHFSNWQCGEALGYPYQCYITNTELSKGGFGAGGDIFPLIAAVAVFYNEEDARKIIKELLSAGADINQKTAIGQTALHIVSTSSYKDRYTDEFSLDDDFDENQLDLHSQTAIFLIDNGAVVNICDDYGKTPLHYAASAGKR